jgi:hypothetical protein
LEVSETGGPPTHPGIDLFAIETHGFEKLPISRKDHLVNPQNSVLEVPN